MKQNNRKNTWKAIVAVMLVIATLFAASSAVSASFVEILFRDEYETMSSSSRQPNIVQFSTNEQANKVAISLGYKGAEKLKEDYGYGSEANLGYDKNTGEIYIIPSNGGTPCPTGLIWD